MDALSKGLLQQRFMLSWDVSWEGRRDSVRRAPSICHSHILHLVAGHRSRHVQDIKGMVDTEYL